MSRVRKLKGQRGTGWAVFNHVGSPWSVQVWNDRESAERYLAERLVEFRKNGWGDLSKHSVHRVTVTISPIAVKETGE